jgi:ribonuclease HII
MKKVKFTELSSSEIVGLWHRLEANDKAKYLKAIEADKRRNVRALAEQFKKQRTKEEGLREEFLRLSTYEDRLRRKGFCLIAGADESGRGALAGPLVAAAVILPEQFFLPGLKDCKLLSRDRRDEFYHIITEQAVSWQTAIVEPAFIDEVGLHKANISALVQALKQLDPRPQYVLTDGFSIKNRIDEPHLGVIKGDRLCLSVAAASVVSKVTRDRIMECYHKEYPLYGFNEHKGYGTLEHRQKIEEHGPCLIHRRSFAGVCQTQDA